MGQLIIKAKWTFACFKKKIHMNTVRFIYPPRIQIDVGKIHRPARGELGGNCTDFKKDLRLFVKFTNQTLTFTMLNKAISSGRPTGYRTNNSFPQRQRAHGG